MSYIIPGDKATAVLLLLLRRWHLLGRIVHLQEHFVRHLTLVYWTIDLGTKERNPLPAVPEAGKDQEGPEEEDNRPGEGGCRSSLCHIYKISNSLWSSCEEWDGECEYHTAGGIAATL